MQGVMYDSAQSYYQLSLANQIGDATPTLHLFSSDDTPTPNVSPTSYQELSNDSYAPLPVPDGYWQFLTSPLPFHFGIIDAEWNLGPPGPFGDKVIHGWWLDGFSPRLGDTAFFYGGRFDQPVAIPPAGLVLTLGEIDLYLHDCGTVPPSPADPILLDGDFSSPAITPGTFSTAPAWPPGTWSGGILGTPGCAFEGPGATTRQGQYAIIQNTDVLSQTVTAGASASYRLMACVAQRGSGGAQAVALGIDGVVVDTISALPAAWTAWESVAFGLSAGDHLITFQGLQPGGTDDTLFLDQVSLIRVLT